MPARSSRAARLGERLVGALLRDGRRQDAVERLVGEGQDAVDALADAGKDAFLDGRERGRGRSWGANRSPATGSALACADQDALLPVEQPEVRGSVGGGIGEQPLEVVRVDAGHEIADHPAGALDPVQRQERRPSEPVGGPQRRQHAALAGVVLARRLRRGGFRGRDWTAHSSSSSFAAADDDRAGQVHDEERLVEQLVARVHVVEVGLQLAAKARRARLAVGPRLERVVGDERRRPARRARRAGPSSTR